MRRVERSSNITFAVGTLEDAGAKWLAGRDALGIDDPSNEHGAADTATGTGFDAVATCFVLDVLSDLRLSLRALHACYGRRGACGSRSARSPTRSLTKASSTPAAPSARPRPGVSDDRGTAARAGAVSGL